RWRPTHSFYARDTNAARREVTWSEVGTTSNAVGIFALAALFGIGLFVSVPTTHAQPPATQTVDPASVATLDAGIETAPKPDVRTVTFKSLALGRAMPYSIYLPPSYATSKHAYPVLYMLHGMSGTNDEWREYGILDAADR